MKSDNELNKNKKRRKPSNVSRILSQPYKNMAGMSTDFISSISITLFMPI